MEDILLTLPPEMQARYFLLNGKEIVPCKSLMEWARMFEQTSKRRVAQSGFRVWKKRPPKKGGWRKAPKRKSVWVSTVFLGLDHGLWYDEEEGQRHRPVLFETMVFAGKRSLDDIDIARYCTWEEAEAGHKEMCRKITKEYRKT